MRVLHVVDRFDAEYGGPAQSVAGLSAALTDAGVDSAVWTSDGGPGRRVSESEVQRDNVPVRIFPAIHPVRRGASPLLLRALAEQIDGFDLLHCHGVLAPTSTFAASIARRRKRPYVISPLGMLDRWGLSRGWVHKTLWLKMFDIPNLVQAGAIRATSFREMRDLRRVTDEENIRVVPHGIRFDQFSVPVEHPSKFFKDFHSGDYLLYLGRLHEKKGLLELIEAFARICKMNPDLQLVIAGSGGIDFTRRLRLRVTQLRLTSVTFLGNVSGDAKRSLLKFSRGFVLPSHDENFGMAPLEAMASSVPVVLSRHVGMVDFLDEGSVFFVEPTVESIADGLVALLRADRDLAGRNALAAAEAVFDWRDIGKKMQALYQMIFDKRST